MKKQSRTGSIATKNKIKESAFALFQKNGAGQIHTHDIAKKAGISPGNLYYHFKNKEEIIREIFNEMAVFNDEKWLFYLQSKRQESFAEFVEFVLENLFSGHFFFREMSSLFRSDPQLKQAWRTRQAQLRKTLHLAVINWVELGVMKRFKSAKQLDSFIELSWIIMTQTFTYLESVATAPAAGEERADLQLQAARLYLEFLKPYHTARGQRELVRYQNTLNSRKTKGTKI